MQQHRFSGSKTLRPGRPPHRLAAKQVKVDMEHRLPGIGVAVHHHAVAAPGQALDRCHLPGGLVDAADYRGVAGIDVVDGGDMLAWDHQHVGRRLRVEVAKSHHLVVLIKKFSIEIAAGDPAMVRFLESLQPEVVNSLRDSDLGFIRVLEDVVDLLVEQQVIQLGDLPQDAQDKITQRKHCLLYTSPSPRD